MGENTIQDQISVSILRVGEDLRCFAGFREAVTVSMVLSGAVTVQLAGSSYPLSTGDIYIAAPHAVYGISRFSEDAQLLLVTFSMEVIRTQPEHFFYRDFWQPLSQGMVALPNRIPASHPAAPALSGLMLELTKTSGLRRFACLMEICLQLIPLCTYPPENQPVLGVDNRKVRLCMIYIINFYHRKFELKRVARYVKCHPNYLCALFKSHTGMTVVDYLYQIRVEAAAELLETVDLSISKVSELTGFPSRNMFYKKFRQIMGISPTVYRSQYSGDKSLEN